MKTRLATCDALLLLAIRSAAAISAGVLALVFVFVVVESWPALRHVGAVRFIADPTWRPHTQAAAGAYNLTPMVVATLLTSAGAVALAAPLGIASAVYCHFFAPCGWVATTVRRMIELLAGVPSVVYGFWGLVTIVPLVARAAPPGASLLTATLILALMILPTMALAADAAIAGVPRDFLQAAASLGMSRSTTIWRIVLPSARSGLTTGLLLQAGRALGETMAVLMVCGGVVRMPSSLFDPVRTLTANIALEMAYALGDHRSALFVCGLLVLVLVACLAIAAELASSRALNAHE